MTRLSAYSVALGVALLAIACTDTPTAVVPPDIALRMGKPVAPAPSSITVMALGTLPYSGTSSANYGIAAALSNGPSRSAIRVAGSTKYGTISEHPFTWTQASGMKPLAMIEPHVGWSFGISDAGLIVGETNTSLGLRAFKVTPDGPMTYLAVPSGTTKSGARGISADGSCISGWVKDETTYRAVVWRDGSLEILGNGIAEGVSSDCLTVAGFSAGRATIWQHVAGAWSADTLPSRGPGARFIGPVKS